MERINKTIWLLVLLGAVLVVVRVTALAGPGESPALLPAAGDKAVEALLQSPRHGEWVEVPMGEGAPPLRTWIVYPERAQAAPVVLVIHEIFGLSDWIRAVADDLAAAGYVAVAPDLLSGKGPGGGGTEAFAGDAVRAAVLELSDDVVVARLNAVRRYALELPATTAESAVLGFCWGGMVSFTYATRQPGINAAVVFYGMGPGDPAVVRSVQSPVLGLYGGDDARVTSTVAATKEAMAAAEKSFEAIVYEGAGHAFLRQQEGRDGANVAAAAASWVRTRAFLDEHLAPPAGGPPQ